jgi:cytosine/adenosine deaminase-related metal-dependent hydrolase
MHPETAAACHWKRGFHNSDARVQPMTWPHSLSTITTCVRDAGFKMICLLEPAFGLSEFDIFRLNGKLDAFHAAAEMPAIYIVELRPAEPSSPIEVSSSPAPLLLRGVQIALDSETAFTGDIGVNNGRVEAISSRSSLHAIAETALNTLHLQRYLLLPGLINAHDHLEFGLYPNLGCGPYRNAGEWAQDIQRRDKKTIEAHQSVPRDIRLWWGAIRNLVCGVTTVCHHNELHAELLRADFPVRVVTNCGWAHSPAVDPQFHQKVRAIAADAPFVLHACEGIDERSASEIFEIDRLNALDARTVLIHGLALAEGGIALLNTRGAAMVWCPTSNRFLFGRTHGNAAIGSIKRVLLGSDSPLTAAGDLLDEIRFVHEEARVPVDELYRMIFERPREAFRLSDGQGSIRPGAAADLIAVRDNGLSPAETVAKMKTGDIELVIVGGRVHLASEAIYRRLPADHSQELRPIEVDSVLRWIRAPLARLFRGAGQVLGNDFKLGGKQVRHVCSAWI